MNNKKAAPVRQHRNGPAVENATRRNFTASIIALARTVCKGLAAGMIGVAFALLIYGSILACIAVFAAAALLAWAVER